jgi:hypothetical protein
MAFTEFITHGIGSSFATQAGAQASTGNVSLGNLSMDNVGMHKYSTVMSAAVGQQQVQASFGAGHSLSELEAGGTMATANGQNETPSVNRSTGVKLRSSHGMSAAMSMDAAQNIVAERKSAASETRDTIDRVGSLLSEASNLAASANVTTSEQRSARAALSQAASEATKATQSQASIVSGGVTVSGKMGTRTLPGLEVAARLDYGYQLQKNKANDKAVSLQHAIDRVHSADESAKRSLDASHTTGRQTSSASDSSTRRSIDDSLAKVESLSESFKRTESWTQSFQLERQTSEMDSQTMARAATGYDGAPAVNVAPALAAAEGLSSPPANLAEHAPTFEGVNQGQAEIGHEMDGRRAGVERKSGELGAAAPKQLDTSIGTTIVNEQGSLHRETAAAMADAEHAQASARQSIADLRSWDPLQDTKGNHPLFSELKSIL